MTIEEEMAYEMLPEYDLSNARSNPYIKGIAERQTATAQTAAQERLVTIAPDLIAVFPDSEAVDAALREYLKVREAA